MSTYSCPHCQVRPFETVVSLPFVRGFLLAYQVGTKKLVGCCSCVRRQIYAQTGWSALIGWFSWTAVILNPICIVYGLARGIVVRPDTKAVARQLAAAGLPTEPTRVDPLQVSYSLAVAMIAADGKIDPREVQWAVYLGQQWLPGFDPAALNRALADHRKLPDVNALALLLRSVLDDNGKLTVYRYLEAIAHADGQIEPTEQAILAAVGAALWPPQAAATA